MRTKRRELREYLRLAPGQRAQRRAPVDEGFYFWDAIKNAVTHRCLGKCVFCERGFGLVETQVETFRPTRAAGDLHGGEMQDHYAWLAYDTDNLVLVCLECSSRKRTEFPLKGERAPYLAALAEINRRERPLIVDPYRGRPDRHLLFLSDGRCEGVTKEGRVTVGLLGLSAGRLARQRADDLSQLLDELRAAIRSSRPRVIELFEKDRTFAGARLSIVRRILSGVEIAGIRIEGAMSSLARRFEQALADANSADRDRLLRRIAELIEEDRVRELDDPDGYRNLAHVDQAASREPEYHPEPARTGGVRRVHIQDFKGIHQLDINVRSSRKGSKSVPCLMLLGENAVGKSSVLQGIALALIGAPEARRLSLIPEHILRAETGPRFDQLTPENAAVHVDLRFGDEASRFELLAEDRRITGTGAPACVVLGYGPRRYFDPNRLDRANPVHGRVKTLFDPTAALTFPGVWLDQLRGRRFEEFAKAMRVVLSLSDTDEVVRDVDDRICVQLAGSPIPIERLSDGYRSVFALVADIARELLRDFRSLEDAEAVVLIDEIETHLHPRWKMRVMSSLRRALPRVQFIVTTHDPLCLRGMDDGEVVVLQRQTHGRIVQLDDLPSIKGMRADQLLTSDYFGLFSTMDPETELGVARFVDAVGDLPPERVDEANALVQRLVLGDDAMEQVVQEALLTFLRERERPRGSLRTDVRREAVQTIIDALHDDGPSRP